MYALSCIQVHYAAWMLCSSPPPPEGLAAPRGYRPPSIATRPEGPAAGIPRTGSFDGIDSPHALPGQRRALFSPSPMHTTEAFTAAGEQYSGAGGAPPPQPSPAPPAQPPPQPPEDEALLPLLGGQGGGLGSSSDPSPSSPEPPGASAALWQPLARAAQGRWRWADWLRYRLYRHYLDAVLLAVIAVCAVENDLLHAGYLALALLFFRRRVALRSARNRGFAWLPAYNFGVMAVALLYQAPLEEIFDWDIDPEQKVRFKVGFRLRAGAGQGRVEAGGRR